MAGLCGSASSTGGTRDLVDSQISRFTQKGDEAFAAALTALDQIAGTFESKIEAAGLNLDGAETFTKSTSLPEFEKPDAPGEPEISFNPPADLVEPPNFENTDFRGLSSLRAPTYNVGSEPQLQMPAQPSTVLPQRPDDPSPLSVPTYPSSPTLTDPILPRLRDVSLPTLIVPDLSAIQSEIAALRNSLPEAPELPDNIEFTSVVNSLFSSARGIISNAVPGLLARLSELLSGNSTGISSSVALLLRNRAFAAEDQQAQQALNEVQTDWLSRGFTLPSGALEAKRLLIQQQNRDKKAALNRDLWIEESKQEIENVRAAIQQGVAYESMHMDALIKLYGICGQLAEKQADVQLKLLDAAVAIYKAQAEVWQIQFSVIKDEIQIELAKVEVFKAELEGQKLIGQLNQQDVEVYRAQLDALNSRVAIYKTQVEAANSLLQAELGKLDYAKTRVQIYTAEIGAYETEWKAYGEAIRGELGKTELYKSLVQGFSAQVEAYAKNVDAEKTKASLEIETMGLKLKTWEARNERYKTQLQTESIRIESLAKVYDSTVRAFGVKSQAEEARVSAGLKGLDYELNVDKFSADVLIKNAELEQTRTLALSKLSVDAMDAVARTGAQLAGSAMSAMNVGASLSASDSNSDSTSCSTSYSYDMTG